MCNWLLASIRETKQNAVANPQPCPNVPAGSNFAPFSQLLAAYSTLDFTRSPLAGKGTWHLLPTTPDMLPTATKQFDRAGPCERLSLSFHPGSSNTPSYLTSSVRTPTYCPVLRLNELFTRQLDSPAEIASNIKE